MESLRIDILNPKARKLLDDLADLKLIHISDDLSSKKTEASGVKAADRSRSKHNGKRIATILQEIADNGGITSIKDPVAWQREQRKDRKIR